MWTIRNLDVPETKRTADADTHICVMKMVLRRHEICICHKQQEGVIRFSTDMNLHTFVITESTLTA